MLGLIISIIVVGLIAGAVARLVVPGHQNLSIPMTILLGIIGSFVGGLPRLPAVRPGRQQRLPAARRNHRLHHRRDHRADHLAPGQQAPHRPHRLTPPSTHEPLTPPLLTRSSLRAGASRGMGASADFTPVDTVPELAAKIRAARWILVVNPPRDLPSASRTVDLPQDRPQARDPDTFLSA